jgi:hypothetical protein
MSISSSSFSSLPTRMLELADVLDRDWDAEFDTTVQKQLAALHHLDAPWKPAEVEQRDGRILRQGNENVEVSIYRYVTEGSFDAYMWQALETKARFINQVVTGDNAIRTAEDIGGQELSYAEVKAIASGNPAVLTLAEADAELQRLAMLKKNHLDVQFLARRNVRDLPDIIERYSDRLEKLTTDGSRIAHHDGELVTISGRAIQHNELIAALTSKLEWVPALIGQSMKFSFGTYHGLEFGLILDPEFPSEVYLRGTITRKSRLSHDYQGPRAVLNALERLARSYAKECDQLRQDLTIAQSQLCDYESRLGKPFLQEKYHAELLALRDQLKISLSATTQQTTEDTGPSTWELARQINELKATQQIEASPERPRQVLIAAEEPITIRVRQRETMPSRQFQHPAPPI